MNLDFGQSGGQPMHNTVNNLNSGFAQVFQAESQNNGDPKPSVPMHNLNGLQQQNERQAFQMEHANVIMDPSAGQDGADQQPTFNGKTYADLVYSNQHLNLFQRVATPRLLENVQGADNDEYLSMKTFDKLKESLLCPVCTGVYENPYNVRQCMHKFCCRCIEDYNRIYKKECPSCRTTIGSRRQLRRDRLLTTIIDTLVTDVEKFNELESVRRQRRLERTRERRQNDIVEERRRNFDRQITQQLAYKRDKEKIKGEMKTIKRCMRADRTQGQQRNGSQIQVEVDDDDEDATEQISTSAHQNLAGKSGPNPVTMHNQQQSINQRRQERRNQSKQDKTTTSESQIKLRALQQNSTQPKARGSSASEKPSQGASDQVTLTDARREAIKAQLEAINQQMTARVQDKDKASFVNLVKMFCLESAKQKQMQDKNNNSVQLAQSLFTQALNSIQQACVAKAGGAQSTDKNKVDQQQKSQTASKVNEDADPSAKLKKKREKKLEAKEKKKAAAQNEQQVSQAPSKAPAQQKDSLRIKIDMANQNITSYNAAGVANIKKLTVSAKPATSAVLKEETKQAQAEHKDAQQPTQNVKVSDEREAAERQQENVHDMQSYLLQQQIIDQGRQAQKLNVVDQSQLMNTHAMLVNQLASLSDKHAQKNFEELHHDEHFTAFDHQAEGNNQVLQTLVMQQMLINQEQCNLLNMQRQMLNQQLPPAQPQRVTLEQAPQAASQQTDEPQQHSQVPLSHQLFDKPLRQVNEQHAAANGTEEQKATDQVDANQKEANDEETKQDQNMTPEHPAATAQEASMMHQEMPYDNFGMHMQDQESMMHLQQNQMLDQYMPLQQEQLYYDPQTGAIFMLQNDSLEQTPPQYQQPQYQYIEGHGYVPVITDENELMMYQQAMLDQQQQEAMMIDPHGATLQMAQGSGASADVAAAAAKNNEQEDKRGSKDQTDEQQAHDQTNNQQQQPHYEQFMMQGQGNQVFHENSAAANVEVKKEPNANSDKNEQSGEDGKTPEGPQQQLQIQQQEAGYYFVPDGQYDQQMALNQQFAAPAGTYVQFVDGCFPAATRQEQVIDANGQPTLVYYQDPMQPVELHNENQAQQNNNAPDASEKNDRGEIAKVGEALGYKQGSSAFQPVVQMQQQDQTVPQPYVLQYAGDFDDGTGAVYQQMTDQAMDPAQAQYYQQAQYAYDYDLAPAEMAGITYDVNGEAIGALPPGYEIASMYPDGMTTDFNQPVYYIDPTGGVQAYPQMINVVDPVTGSIMQQEIGQGAPIEQQEMAPAQDINQLQQQEGNSTIPLAAGQQCEESKSTEQMQKQ